MDLVKDESPRDGVHAGDPTLQGGVLREADDDVGWDRRRALAEIRLVGLILLLALAMVMGGAMQYALGTLGPYITDELDLSKVKYALLPASLSLSGSLLSPVAGRVVDRQGARRAMVALFAIAVAASALVVSATAYAQLFAATMLMGLTMALANPATNQAVSSGVAPGRQGTVVGYKQAGVPLSTVLAGLALPAIAAPLGWRAAMAAMALPALLGIVLAPLLVARHTAPAAGTGDEGVDGAERPARGLARLLALYALLMGLGQGAIGAFLPLYVHERLGQSVATAGALLATFGIASMAARILWGYLANHSASLLRVLRHLAFVAAAAAALVAIAGLADWRLVWVGAVGFGFTSGAWHIPMWVTIIRRFGVISGHVSGLVTRGFFLGLMLSPIVFGFALDFGAGYVVAWTTVGVTFLGAAFVRPDVRAAAGRG